MYRLLITLTLALVSSNNCFAIDPIREYTLTPDALGISYTEEEILTSDSCALNVWMMRTPAAEVKHITILVAGSDAGNMGFTLPYVSYFLRSGYDVVTFDYRGFGESADFNFSQENLYHEEFVEDFVTVTQWAKEQFTQNKLGVLAFSMGTVISTIGYHRSPFDFLVGEGYIASPLKNVQRIEEAKGKKLLLPEGAGVFSGLLNDVPIPMLVFASTTDQITTLDDAKQIVAERENRKLVEYEGDHLRGAAALGIAGYVDRINAFVTAVFD